MLFLFFPFLFYSALTFLLFSHSLQASFLFSFLFFPTLSFFFLTANLFLRIHSSGFCSISGAQCNASLESIIIIPHTNFIKNSFSLFKLNVTISLFELSVTLSVTNLLQLACCGLFFTLNKRSSSSFC